MEFRLLGSMEASDRGRPIELRAAKERALLAELVLHANRVVSRDQLMEVVWGDRPPVTAGATLNTYISHLRAVVEPERGRRAEAQVLLTRPPGYLLAVEEDNVDAAKFERLVATGRRALEAGDAPAARAALTEALDLWRGPALADFVYEPWAQLEAARLEELRLTAIEQRVEADLALGRHHELTGELRHLVAEHRLRERLWGQLMVALYRSGRQSEALRAYADLREVLAEELGIDPSPQLRQLEEDILNQRTSLDPPPLTRSAPAPTPAETNLPTPLTNFVGREVELDAVRRLCGGSRLVTLTGAGGMGKSRLALEVSRGMLDHHPDGVFLVELAPLSDPAALHEHVLSAMGVAEAARRTPEETLVESVASRKILLLLDNCEHLVELVAALVAELLGAGPGVHVLATSREALRVPGETVWTVPSLTLPDPGATADALAGAAAVRLFLDRARAAAPQFEVPDKSLPILVEICQRLDGCPLAIELAAAAARVLSLPELLERLESRFAVLDAGARTGPRRHQSLQAVVDWSYRSLTSSERALFGRLSVFAGGFTFDAAEEVCAGGDLERRHILATLSGLVDKSVVLVDRADDTTRYRMLETLREYGGDRLAESEDLGAVRSRHLDWAVSFASTAESALDGPYQAIWLERLDREHDNVRHALAWAEATDRSSLLALATSLGRFWEVRGFLSEGRRWLALALAHAAHHDEPAEVTAKANRWAGVLAQRQGDYEAARRHYEAGLASTRSANDLVGTASALHSLGNLEGLQGRLGSAAALYEESLAIGRSLGNMRIVAASLTNLGWIAQTQSEFDRARQLSLESLAAWRQLGDQRGMAQSLTSLAYLSLLLDDNEAVRSRCEESLAIQRALGDRYGEAWSYTYMGWAMQNEGDAAPARELHERALLIRRELGDRYGEAWSLSHLGALAIASGELDRAGQLLNEALCIAEQLDDTYCIAWSTLRLGRLAVARNEWTASESLFRQGLTAASKRGDKVAVAACLEGLAHASANLGQYEQAASLIGMADALRRRTGALRPRADHELYERTCALIRCVLGEDIHVVGVMQDDEITARISNLTLTDP